MGFLIGCVIGGAVVEYFIRGDKSLVKRQIVKLFGDGGGKTGKG